MGIFGAMTTAVSGLRAQSYSLENISGNIANSQTTGFKRVETSFVDMIPDTPPNRGLAGSVTAYSRLTNTIQGDLQPTGISTNMAINGEGYFIVRERTGTNNTDPVFSGRNYYTRRGDFSLDRSGHLVNGAGFYLRGETIDPATGQVRNGGAGVIQISQAPLPATKTETIKYAASLPSRPATNASIGGAANSELLSLVESGGGYTGAQQSAFLDQTISGGSIVAYNEIGAPVDVQFRWGKTNNGTAGPPATSGTWNLYYMTNSTATGGTQAWRNVGTSVTFDTAGRMTLPAAPGTLSISNLTIDGLVVGDVTVDFGDQLRQYPATNGAIQGAALQQNGFPTGTLDSVAVNSDGLIVGNYSNGRIVPVGRVTVVQFNADNALKRGDGGTYEETFESGPPIIGMGSANLTGGHVENSNTDIAEEFSKMIVTQQAYSANTRVVSTAQQMMQDIINIVR
ncbi:flagellar hook protein FlgE [Salinarimonas soli]|uniref:Flagellar hook protein FlgE n=1 Tax=Salinarimonas soli TaxID=1638099 RepID=A0A5B2VHB8_9HYPH|nr:flagellar hook-basal body complex protein [Salinarimonas soli]KAA2237577.1 flagellar hook-basal body complex protein [Salinarimonas soli]